MMNFLMLLVAAAGASSLSACAPSPMQPQPTRPMIIVHAPGGEQGDFRICEDGRVFVFPVSQPKSCN
jgi:hypothetical protein